MSQETPEVRSKRLTALLESKPRFIIRWGTIIVIAAFALIGAVVAIVI